MSQDLINRFGREIEVRTHMNGSYVEGVWVEPAFSVLTITASVQQLSPTEVLLLEEGSRKKRALKVYSTYPFKTQEEGSMQKSDYLLIDGNEYMVVLVDDYMINQAMNLKYYKAVAVLINPKNS